MADNRILVMTYRNMQLCEIQIYVIHSELEQCIGKSRLLRENAIVYVFLDFPCEQAEIIQEDYLTGQQKGADVPAVTHRQN